ncbi:MAG: 50S ribosomal protein L11 methyltransferase [Bacteroidota bacterium]
MNYLEYSFSISPVEPAREILIAELGELGFDSFVEVQNGLLAYILSEQWSNPSLDELFILQNSDFQISWTSKEIEPQNWNEEWEKNFKPIEISNNCRVRAPFHQEKKVPFEIIIAPKMSFGTGHHETTYMMLKLLLEEDLKGKKVLDMGCGTGVLGILTEMLGATQIDAIDIDEWCVENTIENMQKNKCVDINVELGDASILKQRKYDVIIANINRNILLKDIPIYSSCLNQSGLLLLSGFYLKDLDMISSKCISHDLQFEKNLEKNNWVAAKYVH